MIGQKGTTDQIHIELEEAKYVLTDVKYSITPVHKHWIHVLHVQVGLDTHIYNTHFSPSLFAPDTRRHTRTHTHQHTRAPVLCMCMHA